MLRNVLIGMAAITLMLFGAGQRPAPGSGLQFTAISAGTDHTCALQNGQAYCWGDNGAGQLGNGTFGSDRTIPSPVDTSGVLSGVTLTQISADFLDTCALDSAGAAFCWGDSLAGSGGQLGDGSAAGSDVPVAVDTSGVLAGKTLTQISVGGGLACALDSAGAAYCWGDDRYGELGNGTVAAYSDVPVAVDTSGLLAGKTLIQISAGNAEACALDSAGTAYCWGSNSDGGLGNGSQFGIGTPVVVAVDTSGVLAGKTLTQISAGNGDVCALDTAGTAYCWGYNNFGEIGNTSVPNAGTAVPVAVDTSGVLAGKTLTEISAVGYHTCAIDSAGLAYCWGSNQNGELGDGTDTQSRVPVAVDSSGVLAGAVLTEIVSGEQHTCALDTSGTAYCWGLGYFGELGDGPTTSSDVPTTLATVGAPEPPQDVQGSAGPGQATVTWSPPPSDSGSPVTSYTVIPQLLHGPGVPAPPVTVSGPPATITGLTVGQIYDFNVEANNAIGSSTPTSTSSIVVITTSATQPTTTALASSANPSSPGQAVTYAATISPVPDGGTVAFTDDGTAIAGCGARPVSTSTGQATCQTTPGAAGAHNIAAAFTGSGGFSGSTSAILTQVVTTAHCPSLAGCNLSGLDLANAQLPGANLTGGNLKGTNLTAADLSSADLSGTNLKGADLSGADLSGANLSGANLNSANLSGANLSGAEVTGANFGKVIWSDTTCPDGTNSNADGRTCMGHL